LPDFLISPLNKRLLTLPAEWETQFGVQLTWPHKNSDWGDSIQEVEICFLEITLQISRFENLLIACQSKQHVQKLLASSKANLQNITLVELPSNDVWARDHGAISVYENNKTILLDFGFNGWGLKYKSNYDNQISRTLHQQGKLKADEFKTLGLILEGGSIESDGLGTILTTSNCLLSPNRNPHLNKEQIEKHLQENLGAQRVLWLDYGFMAGDDTDSHIDTLARFCSPDTIAYVKCEDPQDEHFEELQKMETQLKSFKTLQGEAYKLIPLPMPQAIYDDEQNRLPGTYANFLIMNAAVLIPIYNDSMDEVAIAQLAKCFPDREIIGIDCNALIAQHGSLHCVTMQYPKGVEFIG